MDIIQVEKRNTKVITDILCDCCGKSCKVDESITDNEVRLDYLEKSYSFEFMELKANWGYESRKDLEQWTAKICEKCVDERLSFIKFEKKTIQFKTVLGV